MNIIKDRIKSNVCPLCAKKIIESKLISDPTYGEVKICKSHYVNGEKPKEQNDS